MHPLYPRLQNPLTRAQNASDRQGLINLFPVLSDAHDDQFLALRPYLVNRPQKFFSQDAFRSLLSWLQHRHAADPRGLRQYLNENVGAISSSLLFLKEINAQPLHDDVIKASDDYETLRFIDRYLHPTYLRLTEGVLTPIARLPAHFSRLDRSAPTDGLDIYNIDEELKQAPIGVITAPYDNTVRNGIGHGGITYLQQSIRYQGKRGGPESKSIFEVIRLFDDMVDTCNGLAAALKTFFILHRDDGYELPQELLLQELHEETKTPWWRVEGCIQSEIANKPQLLIYVRPSTRMYGKVFYSTIQTGIFAEYFAPGFDRYFLSLRSPQGWVGWAGFDGKKMRELRQAGASDLEEYKGIVEGDLVFYSPAKVPDAFGKIDSLIKSFKTTLPPGVENLRKQLGIPKIAPRHVEKVHRNAWGSVLNGSVIVEDCNPEKTAMVIRKYKKRIIRKALKSARQKTGWQRLASQLPLGYARIAVFSKDYRQRRLASFGLDKDLICTIELQRIGRIQIPTIMGSTVEKKGRWRIAWNKAWLDAQAGISTPQ